jgi:hypothetical protein
MTDKPATDDETTNLTEGELVLARKLIPRDVWNWEHGILTGEELEQRFRQLIATR